MEKNWLIFKVLSGQLRIYRGYIERDESRSFYQAGLLVLTTDTYHTGSPAFLITGSYEANNLAPGSGNVFYSVDGSRVINRDATNIHYLWITT